VIVPHSKGLEMIKACIESLLNSDYPSKEIIVIDNNSTDGSASYLENRYAGKVQLLRSPVNLYYARALNLGMKIASGAYIVFLNDDTKVSLTYLSKLVRFMESDHLVGAAQGLMLNYVLPSRDEYMSRQTDQFRIDGGTGQGRSMGSKQAREIFFTAGAAMMVRRELFGRIGGFDDQFVLWWEEVDLCWRIWLAGYRCMLVPDAIVYHKGRATTSKVPRDFSAFHFWKNRLRVVLKYLDFTRLLTVLPRVIFLWCLAALNQILRGSTRVAVATLQAIPWNLRHIRETLRWRQYIRVHVRRVSDSAIYPMSRQHILVIR